MKKSDFFNKSYPTPTDKSAYPVWKKFMALKKEVIKNWQQDVVQQRLGIRHFVDLASCRLDLKFSKEKGLTPVIHLKPVIGEDVQLKLEFYQLFFQTYFDLTVALIMKLGEGLRIYKPESMFSSPPYTDFIYWKKENKQEINSYLALISIIIIGGVKDILTTEHLVLIRTTDDVRVIDNIVRELGIEDLISKTLHTGGHYFDEPDTDLIHSWYDYAKVLQRVFKETVAK